MWSTLLRTLFQIAIRFLVAFLSRKVDLKRLLAYVKEAERNETTSFGKRGLVYRLLKRDDPKLKEHTLNTLVELGVLFFKRQSK